MRHVRIRRSMPVTRRSLLLAVTGLASRAGPVTFGMLFVIIDEQQRKPAFPPDGILGQELRKHSAARGVEGIRYGLVVDGKGATGLRDEQVHHAISLSSAGFFTTIMSGTLPGQHLFTMARVSRPPPFRSPRPRCWNFAAICRLASRLRAGRLAVSPKKLNGPAGTSSFSTMFQFWNTACPAASTARPKALSSISETRKISLREGISATDSSLAAQVKEMVGRSLFGSSVDAVIPARVGLGIDLSKIGPASITTNGSTLQIKLPPVEVVCGVDIDYRNASLIASNGYLVPEKDRIDMITTAFDRYRDEILREVISNPSYVEEAQKGAERVIRDLLQPYLNNGITIKVIS
ncbi:MAG: DUF4230 domain-containing protein [Rhodospirillales bacterium]|nr:MAG: DUF4230 domain-containing protein [Rhodospirillales bacterium]